MHFSSGYKYLVPHHVTTFLIYTIILSLSLIPQILRPQEAPHFTSLEAPHFIPCPLSLEGCQSLHEYCPSGLSGTQESFCTLCITLGQAGRPHRPNWCLQQTHCDQQPVMVQRDPYPFPWSRDTKHVTSMQPGTLS